jgi:hypothetical protein
MAINYVPSEMIRRFAKNNLVSKVIGNDLKINRAAIKMIASSGIVSEKKLEEMASNVIKQYKASIALKVDEGETKSTAKKDTLNKKKLIINRVKNLVVNEISNDIKLNYKGEKYIWLPSTAVNPDPVHQLKYGKTFTVGVGEMPGDRYGCLCGMQVLTDDDQLDI